MMSKTIAVVLLAAACVAGSPVDALAQSAKTLYTRALDRERTLRDAPRKPTLKQMRAVVASYEAIVRRYPTSGYSDNALWQAANLSFLAFDEFGDAAGRRTRLRQMTIIRKA